MVDGDWQAYLRQASALRRAGQVDEAIIAYHKLLAINPSLPDSWYNLAWLQRRARQFEPALISYGKALALDVADPQEVYLNRAVILADDLSRPDEARTELESALAIDPGYVPALLNLGNLAEDRGQREEALAAYRLALDAEPLNALALARLADVSPLQVELLDQLDQALRRPGLAPAERADLGFSLTRMLDLAGRHGEAFAAATAANVASRQSFGPTFQPYRPDKQEERIGRIIAAFRDPISGSSADSGAPLFICGMFRSGSTLCEQILASHEDVQPGGELDLLPEMVERQLRPYPEAVAQLSDRQIAGLRQSYCDGLRERGLTGQLVTDKRPDNFLHIGLIKTMFPNARIVHTRRAALDNLLSLYFLHLAPEMSYALDLEDAAHWMGQHDRLMAHWKNLYPDDIFEFDYDTLVADPDATIRALLDFCGIPWDDNVLNFHSAINSVKTASVWQVRQPLHARSSGRWRNYEREMGPLADLLKRP